MNQYCWVFVPQKIDCTKESGSTAQTVESKKGLDFCVVRRFEWVVTGVGK
jgi:hypothetical protein